MITFAGYPLLLEDPQGDLATWLEWSLSLADLRLFGSAPVALADGRLDSRSQGRAKVRLPAANWSQQPTRLKINSLWWPTGASRWALGLFLVGADSLASIMEAVDDKGAGDLVLKETEDEGQEITFNMFMLPPRPITTPSGTDERLFILPLVDQRYFWQFIDAGDFEVDCESEWDTLLGDLGAILTDCQVTVDAVDADFYEPHKTELTRRYENAAVLLDVLAWCVGQRIVAYPNGTIHSQSASFAKDQVESNLESASVWSGGLSGDGDPGEEPIYEQPRRPEKVRVVFPRYVGGTPLDSGDVYKIDVDGSDYVTDTSTLVAGRVKTFFDTAAADFSGGLATPDNSTALTTLAEAIAEAYYDWLDVETYDLSFPGLKYWVQNGFDDATWWHWGSLQPRAEPGGDHCRPQGGAPYAAYTRVTSLPVDWGFSQLIHQVDCLEDGCSLVVIRFQVTSLAPYLVEISSGCIAVNAEILSVSGGADVNVGDDVIIWDPSSCWFSIPIDVLEGAHGIAVRMQKGAYWDIPDCVDQVDDGPCWWLVQNLCCVEEVYYQ